MLFSEDVLVRVRESPAPEVLRICREVLTSLGASSPERRHQVLLETYALLRSLRDSGILALSFAEVPIAGNLNNEIGSLTSLVSNVAASLNRDIAAMSFRTLEGQYTTALGAGFSYEFSQGDFDRVQSLLNELRGLISAANDFEEDHKRRLLRRLERLQQELHKRMSDLDHYWGLVGDAGVALGKFGKDAKPFVDRIRELTGIVWRTQARAEELPSSTPVPLLKHDAGGDDALGDGD